MAKRKRKARTHHAAPRTKRAVTTARRRRSRKRGLSDAFTPAAAKRAALDLVKGAAGGAAVAVIEKGVSMALPGTTGRLTTTVAVVAGSFLAHSVLGQPAIAAGMIGAEAHQWMKQIPGLNDDADFADDDALYDDAPYMDEDGNAMDEDGNYLSAGNSGMYLSDPSAMMLSAGYDSWNNY